MRLLLRLDGPGSFGAFSPGSVWCLSKGGKWDIYISTLPNPTHKVILSRTRTTLVDGAESEHNIY